MENEHKVNIFKTAGELAEAVAQLMIVIANRAIEASGKFVLSLSGGHTPEQLFALLSTETYKDLMPWSKTFIFWGDERCVLLDDKDNNAYMAQLQLLDHIDIPKNNIYPIPVNLQPAVAAATYEHTIKSFFDDQPLCFDLILLGLGTNGHTASLFPGNNDLYDDNRLVTDVYIAEQKMSRITMCPALINKAHNIIFLVAGEEKADILTTVLTASYQPDRYPAQLINPIGGNLYWYADSKAGAHLPTG